MQIYTQFNYNNEKYHGLKADLNRWVLSAVLKWGSEGEYLSGAVMEKALSPRSGAWNTSCWCITFFLIYLASYQQLCVRGCILYFLYYKSSTVVFWCFIYKKKNKGTWEEKRSNVGGWSTPFFLFFLMVREVRTPTARLYIEQFINRVFDSEEVCSLHSPLVPCASL